jgi:hypothetical protein
MKYLFLVFLFKGVDMRHMKKKIAVIMLFLISGVTSMAQSAPSVKSGDNTFDMRKTRIIKNHDARMLIITEAKACLAKAESAKDLRPCLDAERKSIADLKEKNQVKAIK